MSEPLVVLWGISAWLDRASAVLAADGFAAQRHSRADGLLTHLIDDYPAALVIDAALPNWHRHIAAVKTDQATRRLPLLAVMRAGHTPADRDMARAAGADGVLSAEDIDAGLPDWVRTHGRLPDPAEQAALARQCGEPLPPLGQLGVKRFNAGAYYAQHDAFEALWMEETGPVRELYRAVLQVGVAYYHITRGNPTGALKMLRRSVQWFAPLPDTCQGIDVRQLREDAARVRAALEALAPADIAAFDRSLLKPIRLVDA
jgi:predicted metal-dependent hydrolase